MPHVGAQTLGDPAHVPAGRYAAYVCHAGCFDWIGMFAVTAGLGCEERAQRFAEINFRQADITAAVPVPMATSTLPDSSACIVSPPPFV